MTATLTFTLPEERAEHRLALEGWQWKAVASDVVEGLRTRLKHDDQLSEAVGMALFEIRNEVLSLIENRGLDLYE